MEIIPVTLQGIRIRLEPLALDRHFEGLAEIGLDPELWRWTLSVVETREDLLRYLEEALRAQAERKALPFATVDRATGRVLGCTRFGNIEPEHRRVEIGWTWVGRTFQRTHVNSEAKYLMLSHAFDTWRCARVELKTNALNRRSRERFAELGRRRKEPFASTRSATGGWCATRSISALRTMSGPRSKLALSPWWRAGEEP